MMKKITYVVALKNNVKELPVFLQNISFLKMDYLEFIFVDAGSTDGSVKLLAETNHKYISEPDTGIYNAWNKGIVLSSGDFIGFLGVDDDLTISFVNEAFGLINRIDCIGIIYGNIILEKYGFYRFKESPESPELLHSVNPFFDLPHPGMLVNSRFFYKSKFDDSFRLAGDFDFFLKHRREILTMKNFHLQVTQAVIGRNGVSNQIDTLNIYRKEFDVLRSKYGQIRGFKLKVIVKSFLYANFPIINKLDRLLWKWFGY